MIVKITRTVTAVEYVSDYGLTNGEIEEEIQHISVGRWFTKGEPEVIKDEIKIERNKTPQTPA